MKFEFGKSTFLLEFERERKPVSLQRKGSKLIKKSTYPYTTVKLVERVGSMEHVVHTATVGCCPTDPYSHAAGRLAAMRKLSDMVATKELRKAMWEAYQNRAKPTV